MESLLGLSIRKETRWNYGNRPSANNKGSRVQCKFADLTLIDRLRLRLEFGRE